MERLLNERLMPESDPVEMDFARTVLNVAAIVAALLFSGTSLLQAATGEPAALLRGYGYLVAIECTWLIGTVSILRIRR